MMLAACPSGQNYPQPVSCTTFSSDGTVSGITGLKPDHTYLFYLDGLRNTKASFNITFNGTGVTPPTTGISLAPNPVKDILTINLKGTSAGKYQFLVYDVLGRLVISHTEDISLSAQTIQLNFRNLAKAVYIVKVVDANGNTLTKQKIIK